jgi:pilus assembly protein CpaE
MSPAIRVLVALDAGVLPRDLDRVLDDPRIEVVAVIEDDAAWVAHDGTIVDALLIACAPTSDGALDFIAEAVRARPDRPVVAVCTDAPNGHVQDFFKAGADDLVVLTSTSDPADETYFALQKAAARRSGAAGALDDRGGALICVLGPKGGIGKTLTAANLGAGLADIGHRVAIVDLDLQFGDLGLAMGLAPERTIYDLATSGGSLDAEKVEAYLASHGSGARVLLAPLRPDQASAITNEFLRDLYSVLRASHDFVVVDTPPGFSPEVITTIDASSALCMVGMLDAPSLKNAKIGFETLDLMGYPPERIRLVLNRADTSLGITHADAVAILGRAPDVLVPSQRDVVRSINAGEPIVIHARRSEPAKAFHALAELFASTRAGAGAGTKPARASRRLLLGRS